MSLGDFDFTALEGWPNLIGAPFGTLIFDKVCWFWIVWALLAYVLCIIFLNFLVAEACELYA